MMKVFQINDYDFWLAESAEQAIQSAAEMYYDFDDLYDLSEIVALSSEEMEKYKFFDEESQETITFSERLSRMIACGDTSPGMFATSEA